MDAADQDLSSHVESSAKHRIRVVSEPSGKWDAAHGQQDKAVDWNWKATDRDIEHELSNSRPNPEKTARSIPILLIQVADERLSYQVNRLGIEKLSDALWNELYRTASQILVELRRRRASIHSRGVTSAAQTEANWSPGAAQAPLGRMKLGAVSGLIAGAGLGIYELALLILGQMDSRFSGWSTPVLNLVFSLSRPEHDTETVLILGFFLATMAFTGAMGAMHGMLFALIMGMMNLMGIMNRRSWEVAFGAAYGALICGIYFLVTTRSASMLPPYQEMIGFAVFGSVLGLSCAGKTDRPWPRSITCTRGEVQITSR